MKYTLSVCILLLFVGTAFAQTSLQLYISPSGDDINTGLSEDSPFETLERARDTIRTLTNPGATTVWLMDGDYYLTSTFVLESSDSGTETDHITYQAINRHQAKLHINKAIPVSDFSALSDTELLDRVDDLATGNISTLDLAAYGIQNTETWPDYFPADDQDLFRIYTAEDGQLPLSRYPNDSMMTMKKVIQNENPGIFEYRGSRHHRWLDAVDEGLWFQGYWRVPWQYDAVRTDEIDTIAGTVTQAASVPGGIGDKYTRPEGNGMEPYMAVNLLDEIDREGEWAINFNNDSLFIWLPSNATEILFLDQDDPIWRFDDVEYVDIIGVLFDYGLGSAIEINDGEAITIAACEIRNFIDDAVVVNDGVNHEIISNDMHDLGAGGIYLSGGNRQTLDEAGHRAVNNHIYEFGQVKVIYAPAIQIPRKYDDNNVGMYVAHNKIHGTPHVGIEFCGNNHTFEYNEIYDICRVSNDMGAFYSWNDWTSYGSIFRHNYIHDSHQAHGMYFDDGDSGDEIYDNIFQGIDVGVFIGGGHDVNAHNNLSIDCEKTIHIDNRGVSRGYNLDNTSMVNRVLSVDHQDPPWSTQYPTIVDILEIDYPHELPNGCNIDCNVGINTPVIVDIIQDTALVWGVTLGANHSDDDTSLDHADLSQIAAAMGYEGESCIASIPYTQIGLIDDQYRLACIDTTVMDTLLLSAYLDGEHLITASNMIETQSSVTSSADLSLRAGNEVLLNEPFSTDGAQFIAEIREVCPDQSDFAGSPIMEYERMSNDPVPPKRLVASDLDVDGEGNDIYFFQLNQSEIVTLDLYNEIGQQLETIERRHFPRGEHMVSIKSLNLAPGKYYILLDTQESGSLTQIRVE